MNRLDSPIRHCEAVTDIEIALESNASCSTFHSEDYVARQIIECGVDEWRMFTASDSDRTASLRDGALP